VSELPANCGNFNVGCICGSSDWITNLSCCVSKACSPADQEGLFPFTPPTHLENASIITSRSVSFLWKTSPPRNRVLAPPLPSRTIISFSIYHDVSFMLTLNQPPSSSHKVSVPPTKLPSLQLLPVQPIPRPLLLATLLPVPPPLPALPLHQPKMLHHLQTLGSLDLVLVWLLQV